MLKKVGFKNLDPVIVDNDTVPEELVMHSDEKNHKRCGFRL